MSTAEPLLDRVASGGAGSAEALLDRYGGLVWSLARRFCADRAEAEDAVQEIMVEVWKSVKQGRFDASKGSETTFVATIARRRLIDRLRRRRIKTSELVSDVASAKSVPTPANELTEEARAASEVLEKLSESQQTAIRLSVLHGLTHEEVAQATGMPLGTVKTHIRRGLIRMREMLASAGPHVGTTGKGAMS